MTSNHAKGVEAERLAETYLVAAGQTILMRRYRCKSGEIDLIGAEGDSLVFTEVKARATLGQALEAITARSQARIRDAALWFSAAEPKLAQAHPGMRFDVVAVLPDNRIERLENAF